jgi:hypothetical protein
MCEPHKNAHNYYEWDLIYPIVQERGLCEKRQTGSILRQGFSNKIKPYTYYYLVYQNGDILKRFSTVVYSPKAV